MPNWCNNSLSIEVKTPEQLVKVIQAITNNSEQPFDFNRIVPIPEELANTSSPNKVNADEMEQKYGYKDWYDWRVVHWGTKWNASDVELDFDSPRQLKVRFNTAWSPPMPIIEKIAEMFPFASISLDWEEEGGYYGNTEYEEGVMTTNFEGEMDCDYRTEKWGECAEWCEECGECDCEVCNCEYRSKQTVCEKCNDGEHGQLKGEETNGQTTN